MQWICIRECFQYSTLFHIGDVVKAEECPGPHFTLLDGLDGVFSPTGRRFVVENNQIVGVWD